MVKKNQKSSTVPQAFCIEPFYKSGDMFHINSEDDGSLDPPFVFDMMYQLQYSLEGLWPWETPVKITSYLVSFKHNRERMAQAFRKRQTNETMPLMRVFLSRFIDIAFWSHQQSISSLETISNQLQQLEYVPINVGERIQFILDQPNHYISYVQLNELYSELEKKLARMHVMQANSLCHLPTDN